MSMYPVDKKPSNRAVDVLTAFRKITQPMRQEEDALMAATVLDLPYDETKARIEAGSVTDVNEARRRIENSNSEALRRNIDDAFSREELPETTAALIANEDRKRAMWNSTGDNLYLEAAIAMQDPTIDAELSRFYTNLQIGEEVLRTAIQEADEETGVAGYIWDFVDRYFLRAMVIGGFEDITGRSVRGGRAHLEAALLANPDEYRRWIEAQVESVKQEGFFTGDNVFALQEEFQRFGNAGQDPLVGLWAALGVVDVLPLGALLTKTLKAGTKVRRVKALAGPEAADDIYETVVKAEADRPDPRTINDGMPEALNVIPDPDGGAGLARTARIRDENVILKEIDHINSQGGLGRGVDSDEVIRAGEELTQTLVKTTGRPLNNLILKTNRDATGGFIWTARMGTVKTGRPYATERAANNAINRQGIREEFPTARAVPFDKEDPSKGWYVEIDQRMAVDPYVDELSWKSALDPIRQMVARFAGSKGATEAENLNTLAVIAEGVVSGLTGGKVAKDLVRSVERLPMKSQDTIKRIFNDLRDGRDAGLRNSYNEMEFRTKFEAFHPEGKPATDKDWEGFLAIQTLSDAAYMQRAHLRLQKYVRNGFQAVVFPDGTRVPGKMFKGQTSEQIWDLADKVTRNQSDLRKNTVIWELDRELDSGIRFVAKPAEIRSLDHSDVLGYNAGGRRINPNANYFVLVNPNNPRAFLTTVTADQAEVAIQQISRIQEAIAEVGESNLRKGGPLDEVVRSNNDWNTELQTIEDFIRFADEKKIDLVKGRIVSKARDGEIATGEVRDGFSQTWDEYVSFGMHRADDVLTEFGGGETRNYDAVSAILDDFGSITHQFAYNDYTQTALHAWLKSARRTGSGWDVGPEVDPRRAFENATLKENTNPAARELGLQRNIIARRLGIKSEAFRAMESYGAAVQEFVFNKTRGRVEMSRDPIAGATQNLLNFGFVSAFGLGNISQFFVQGYHALTVAAITQNSVTSLGSGMKALTMVPALRLALFAPDSATEALALRRLAKATGQTNESVLELVDYIRTSGRDVIDGSAMESGTGQQWGIRGWKGESYLPSTLRGVQAKIGSGWRGTMKAGLTPFREGERMARLTAITTAVLEYQAKFPGKGIATAHARRWISAREQALSFRMSNANRALMQEGFGKLPTQWFTYTLRTFENVLMGRDFTAGERARLAAALFPAFGLTGMGAASATDWLAEKVGAEPAGQMYTFIKYGIVDTLLEMTTGAEIAFAERLAPITLIQDVYSNVGGQKSAWEVALGPSGDIAGGVIEQVMNAAGSVYAGTPVSLTEDVIRVARQWTGVDNVAKAMGIMNTGLYTSRTGRTLPFELTPADAIAQLFGFSPREVSEFYAEKQWQYTTNDKVRSLTNEFRNQFSQAMQMVNDGDVERGMQLLREIQIKIQISGLSPIDQAAIRRGLRVTTSEELYNMIVERTKRGDNYAGERIQESFDFIGTN